MNTQQRNQHDLIVQRALCPTDRKLHIHQAAHQPTSQSHRTSSISANVSPNAKEFQSVQASQSQRVSKRVTASQRLPKRQRLIQHMICILASSTMPCRNIRCAHFQGLWGYVSFTGICWKCGAWWSAQLHGLALSFIATWFWVSRV